MLASILAAMLIMGSMGSTAPVHEEVLFRGEPLSPPAMDVVKANETLAQVLYRNRASAVVSIASADGQGSGTLIRPDGFILTCAHVFGVATEGIQVVMQDGTSYPATVLAADGAADLALLKIEPAAPLPWVAIGDLDSLEVGDPVVAIGHPKGFGWTVNTGIVSNLYVFRDGRRDPSIIQTQVPLNPGNSGGPLLDDAGRIVGVVSQGDPTAQALNWCISARAVKLFLLQNSFRLPNAALTVHASPAGAIILVDGVEVGQAPQATTQVSAGAHVVEVRKEGLGLASSTLVVVQRDAAEIRLAAAAPGTLSVSADQPGVAIYVDDVYRGESPLTLKLAEGPHLVSGMKPGTRNSSGTVVVKPDHEAAIALAHPASEAFLTVVSAPVGAEVVVDGAAIGVTPISNHVVTPGRHVVDVQGEGTRPRRVVVDVGESARRTVDFDLEPDIAETAVASGPTSAGPPTGMMSQQPPGLRSFRAGTRARYGMNVVLGSIAVSALSAAILVTQDDDMVRGAAAASLAAGSAGMVLGPAIILRESRTPRGWASAEEKREALEPAAGARGGAPSSAKRVIGARLSFSF